MKHQEWKRRSEKKKGEGKKERRGEGNVQAGRGAGSLGAAGRFAELSRAEA